MANLEISQESSVSAMPPLGATYQFAQTFTPESDFYLSFVELLMYRQGTPPNMNVDIQGVSGGYPDGNVAATIEVVVSGITTNSAGEWVACVFDPGIWVSSGTPYSIVTRDGWNTDSNRYLWRATTSGDPYVPGKSCRSSNGGSSWGDYFTDSCFRVYSDVPPSEGGSILLSPASMGWGW